MFLFRMFYFNVEKSPKWLQRPSWSDQGWPAGGSPTNQQQQQLTMHKILYNFNNRKPTFCTFEIILTRFFEDLYEHKHKPHIWIIGLQRPNNIQCMQYLGRVFGRTKQTCILFWKSDWQFSKVLRSIYCYHK